MRIKKIEKLKNNKYKMILDEEIIITYDNVILDNNLLYKKEIDKELYKNILESTKYYEIYDKAVKFILKRRRSEKEVRKYLLKFDILENDFNKIIERMKNNKLINDIEYCKAYINDKINFSNDGINKIKVDLLNNDISITVIEEQIENLDKDIIINKLEKMIIKKINLNKKYSNIQLKQKILNEMINLGYDKDIILNIIDKNLKDDNIIIKKEFDKMYLKLSKKYNGSELFINIKNKMIQKGFNIDKINEMINEKTED